MENLDSKDVYKIKDTASKLVQYIINLSDAENSQGLLYGQIQSGKTNNMLMTIAMAADNGSRLFVVLTSDNTWLYEQTLARTREALPSMLTLGNKDYEWSPAQNDARIQTMLDNAGLVCVATKNSRILTRLQGFLEHYTGNNISAVIFDDEADQASLNTLINDDADDLSAINQAIVNLREFYRQHVYVQVTATPQALFLQSADSAFAPKFAIVFSPGTGYVGGEKFFGVDETEGPMRFFAEEEINDIVHLPDLPPNSGLAVPTGMRQALSMFFVGAAVKLIAGQGRRFASLFHVSHRQDVHRKLEILVKAFVNHLSEALLSPRDSQTVSLALQFLREAYNDLSRTHNDLPDFNVVVEEIRDNIPSTQVQVLIAGGEFKTPSYAAPFNVLIGGNRLGRGVTIDRLLVTYYGRTARAPQIDTVLQHARMYGYREKDMDIIRFYTTRQLYDVFCDIYESESQLRTMVEKYSPEKLQAVVFSRSTHSILRPTRPNVIYLDSLMFYVSGRRYFPRNPLVTNVEALDELLLQWVNLKQPVAVPVDFLIEVVNLTESDKTEGGSWDDEAIITCLRNMKDIYQNRGFLVVRTDRDITKGARAMLSPDDEKLYEASAPTLTMYRYTGNVKKGWDGRPLWVPNLRFPDGNTFFMFSLL